jgi:hypothetical protein
MVRKKLAFLTAALLSAAMLWGCGSSGSGGTELQPQLSPDDVARAEGGNFSCTVCHSQAHTAPTGFSPLVGVLNAGENALFILHDCQDCHGGGSAHRGFGPMPHPRPDLARCAVCHGDEIDKVTAADQHVVVNNFGHNDPNCLACHEPLKASVRQIDGSIGCIKCHTSQDAEVLAEKPFSDRITERFEASRKGDPNQRINNSTSGCRACHSHQGAVTYLSIDEKISTYSDMVAAVGAGGIIAAKQAELFPEGWSADANAMKTCATCHDPHASTIRGLGNQTAADLGLAEPGQTATGPANRVVFSAEFNLCTSCHMVNLDVTWNEAAGYNGGGVFQYQLAEIYATATAETNGGLDYHAQRRDGTPRFSRTISTTHFAGTLGPYFDASAETNNPIDLSGEIVGYGVNPGSPNACSSCHDVHSGNKFIVGNNRASVSEFAELIGRTHGNYASDAFSRQQTSTSCMPCHTGREFPRLTKGGTFGTNDAARWNPLGCVSCHDMAVDGAGDITQPRVFPANYQFKFNSGMTQTALLGNSQVCFECHKGRNEFDFGPKLPTPGPSATVTEQVYYINYLHYSPNFATLVGAESGMYPLFTGKEYSRGTSRAQHNAHTCTDCHRIHEEYGTHEVSTNFDPVTNSKATFTPTSLQTDLCASCHYNTNPNSNDGLWRHFDVLRDRTKVFGDVLLEAILEELEAMYNDGLNFNLPAGLAAAQEIRAKKDLLVIFEGIDSGKLTGDLALATTGVFLTNPNRTEKQAFEQTFSGVADSAKARLKVYITGSPRDATGSRLITNRLATAGALWKNFMYDDKAAWAHNSLFARQLMYDAIEDLDALEKLEAKAIELEVPIGLNPADGLNGTLMRGLSVGGTVRELPAVD